MTVEVNQHFREAVVDSANSYIGAPFQPVDIASHTRDTIELGTTADPGFDCSGLVVRSIADAIGRRPRDIWRPELRTVQGMSDNIYQSIDDYQRLMYREVQPGDMIAHLESEGRLSHVMIATDELSTIGLPFVHAVRTRLTHPDSWPTPPGVQAGNLKPRLRGWLVHIPLGQLVEKAIRPDT